MRAGTPRGSPSRLCTDTQPARFFPGSGNIARPARNSVVARMYNLPPTRP